MFLVQEDRQSAEVFKLVIAALDQLLVVGSQSNSVQCIDLPKLPLSGQQLKEGHIQSARRNNITCMDFSKDHQYIAVTTESKQLVIVDANFSVLKTIILPRASSKVCFSRQNDILVADRTGDVYLYKITDQTNEPELLLGHLSVILDMLVTDCGKYIITCDRDEKIRVSLYPNAYNIATFCLGHTEFVSSLALLNSCNVLLSASGDGTVRMWNYVEGKQLNMINTVDLVSDATVIEKFAKQMDLEKVDVTALPITNMQVEEGKSLVTLAISLYSISKLFLFSINKCTLEYSRSHTVEMYADIFSYYLAGRLYVLSNQFEVYEVDGDTLKTVNSKTIQHKLLEYKHVFVKSDCDVTLWYKRKYDNVQEYMERKKIRLESK